MNYDEEQKKALFARAQQIADEEEQKRAAEDGTLNECLLRLAFRVAQLEAEAKLIIR